MNLTIWVNFEKRRNSTKQPTGGDGIYDVMLKENTSLMNPHFIMTGTNIEANYCKWADRYYYIDDIIFLSNTQKELVCTLDVLATFKTAIGNYTTLISRASNSSAWDGRIIDTIYPAKAIPMRREVLYQSFAQFTLNRAAGTIVMGTVGNAGNKWYMMSAAEFTRVCSSLFPLDIDGNTDLDVWIAQNVTQALAGGLQSIMANIVSLKWLPIVWSSALTSDVISTPVSEISIGNWKVNVGVGADPVREIVGNTVHLITSAAFSFLDREEDVTFDQWLRLSPFAEYQLYVPPFGVIPIDGSCLNFYSGRAYVNVDYHVDMLTGNATLLLWYPATTALGGVSAKMIGRYTVCLGYDLKAGGGSVNVPGVITGAGAAIAAIASDNYAGAIGAIGSAVSSAVPTSSQIGGGVSGPSPDLTDGARTVAIYWYPLDFNVDELGRPCGSIFKISTIPGFVQTARAKIEMAGQPEEYNQVNAFLDQGIFYE